MKNNDGRTPPLPLSAKGAGLAFSLTVAVYIMLSLVAEIIIYAFGISGSDAAKYILYLVSPIAIGCVLALYLVRFKQPARLLLPVKCSPKYYLIGLLLIFGLFFSLSSLNELLIELFELFGYERQSSTLPSLEGWRIVPALIVIAIIPVFMEEILFRGIILNNCENDCGTVRSVLLVGMLFCLYHGSVEQTVYQFLCGCLFAFLAVRARSVAPSTFIHFLNNAVIIIFYACGAVDEKGNIVMPTPVQITFTVLSALCLIGAVLWLVPDRKGEEGAIKKMQPKAVSTFFIYALVGIAVMAVMWIAGLFV